MLKSKKLQYTLLKNFFIICISTVLWANNTYAFSYRDNVVDMPFKVNGYDLVTASYTLTDYSVSKGQDPDNKIKIGQTRTYSGNKGSMTFRVGRHKTTAVAKWFTSRIPASRTTFNQDPGALNFAFIGKLELTLSGGVLGVNEDTYTLKDIAIAQGSTLFSNNWWFGGKKCTYVSSDTVTCDGTSSSGYPVKFDFLRGGNSVNSIELKSVYYTPYQTKSLESNYHGENKACIWQLEDKCPPFVIYYDSAQAKGMELSVTNNFLYKSTNKLFDTSAADKARSGVPAAIFVMSPQGKILASNVNVVFLFHHSTLLAGHAVASAGELMVKNGIIQEMTNCSGHYRPGGFSYDQLKEQLKRLGYSRHFSFKSC